MQFSLENLKQNNGYTKKNEVAKSGGALAAMKSGNLVANTGKNAISKKVDTYAAQVIDETSEILRNTRTDIVFVIDKSGSTDGLEGATCAGYNSLIHKEKRSGYRTKITTVAFSNYVNTISFRENVNNILPLEYSAFGETAFYDTLCETIEKVREDQVRTGETDAITLVYIMTDGMDNVSRLYSLDDTRLLIKKYKEVYGWEFLFLGALDNAMEIAGSLGIELDHAVEIEKSLSGMYNSFVSTSKAIDDLRNYGKLTDGWANASKKSNIAIEDKNQKKLGLNNG